jgi:hypothetical protein
VSLAPTEDWPSPPPTFTPTLSPTPRSTLSPTSTLTPTPTPTPLPPLPWRELGYLTSIEYPRVRTVVEVERKRPGLDGILGTDRILLMAVGKIQVGVDLSQVKDEDVQIEDTTVKVILPHAIITSVELLPNEALIYDSKRRWLFSEYEGIEVEALDKAREQLRDETLSNKGMLELGEQLARLQLTDFLRQTGFEEVEITFK